MTTCSFSGSARTLRFCKRSDDKDIDGQQLVDLRRMLAQAGYDAVATELEAEGKEA